MQARDDMGALRDVAFARWSQLARPCVVHSDKFSAWSAESSELVVSALDGDAEAILDIASGCGDPALMIARARPRARVTSVDFIDLLGRELQRRAHAAQLENVEARCADMLVLPFDDHVFDTVTCRFGLQRYSERARLCVLAEAHRVLREGGKLIIVDWGAEGHGAVHAFYQPVLASLSAAWNDQAQSDQGPASSAEQYASQLRMAGFLGIRVAYPQVHWNWDGPPESLWSFLSDVVPPIQRTLAGLTEAAAAAVPGRIEAELQRYVSRGRVELPARNVVATGRKLH